MRDAARDAVRDMLPAPGPARRLAMLAAVTLLMVMMAILAVSTQRAAFTSDFAPRPMFPDLAERVNEASKIVVESRQRKVTVVRDAAAAGDDAVWRVEEKAGHPARAQMVKRTVVGLADLQLAERRTAQPEWHRHLGLRAPEDKGAGVRVAVYDAEGNVMAALIAGKLEGSAAIDGRGSIYVRRDGEAQSYVARGSFNLEQRAANWVQTDVIDLPPGRVERVEVAPAGGAAFTVALADREATVPETDAETDADADAVPAYAIRDLDPALQPKTAYAVDGIGTALAGLTFTDVMAAEEVAFEAPVVSRFFTRDGVVVSATAEKQGDRYLAVFTAEAVPGASEEAVAEARRIAARLSPFAYQLTTFDGADLTRTLDAFTEPAGTGADDGVPVDLVE